MPSSYGFVYGVMYESKGERVLWEPRVLQDVILCSREEVKCWSFYITWPFMIGILPNFQTFS